MSEQNTPEVVLRAIGDLKDATDAGRKTYEDSFRALKAELENTKAASAEQVDKVGRIATELAETKAQNDAIKSTLDAIKRQADSPVYAREPEANDHIRKSTIAFAREAHVAKHGDDREFRDDAVETGHLIALKSAQRKLLTANNEASYQHALSEMSAEERKSMSLAQLDGYLFMPEMQTVFRDCFLEPVGLGDLYDTFSVSKMSIQTPVIKDHAKLGGYICSSTCGTIAAAANNISVVTDRVYDWRGTWCATTASLEESAVNLMARMAAEMALSKRMTSNEAWINGDGVNQPKGWLNANCFPKVRTSAVGALTAADLRAFMNSLKYEYGRATVVMHPDTLAIVATMSDANGRFLFGDGALFMMTPDMSDMIRLTRYVPALAPTAPGVYASGSFVAAAAVWKKAYQVPVRRNMIMQESFSGVGGTPWCKTFNFWAQDGGSTTCCEAGSILNIQ